MFDKIDIKKYSDNKYNKYDSFSLSELVGININPTKEVSFNDFEKDEIIQMNCFDSFFEQIDVWKPDDKILVELIKLGDYDGFYKDWAMHRYMKELNEVCNGIEKVLVNNYEYSEDDKMFRAFFISMLFDTSEYKNFNEIYFACKMMYNHIEKLVSNRLNGTNWIAEYETDEMLFCHLYLTPYFKKLGFHVIFNHGNSEFGKDYILIAENRFGLKEYYGVQVKAGNISGAASGDITTITTQIQMAFTIPYTLINGEKIYISKMVIAISGKYSNNAKEVIQSGIDRYKFSNIIFLSKNELEHLQ